MDLGTDVLKALMTIIRVIFKPVLKFLIFTGLIFPAALYFLIEILKMPIKANGLIWGISWVFCGYCLVQNIIRLFKKDRSFSFLKLIFSQSQTRKEKAATSPGAAKELTAAAPMQRYLIHCRTAHQDITRFIF